MKKFIIIGLSSVLALSVALVSIFAMPQVKAEDETSSNQQETVIDNRTTPEKVRDMLNGYVGEDGQYTKLTMLETENITALGGKYHGNADTVGRRTYYDEKVNALLMGDYNGGFEGINSGYAKEAVDVNNMQHYRNNAEEKTIENLFTARSVDYTVNNTNPVYYYDVLSEIADLAGQSQQSDWSLENGVYTYVTSASEGYLTGTDPYNDGLLKMYQYFASPMLLLNAQLKLAKIQMYESAFYPDGSSATENMLVAKVLNADGVLISTAYVVKGLRMQTYIAPMQVLLGGKAYDLVVNANATLAGDQDKEFMLAERVKVAAGTSISFKVNGWDKQLEGAWEGDFASGATSKAGMFQVYFKTWKDGKQSAYFSIGNFTTLYLASGPWCSQNINDNRFCAYFFNGAETLQQWVNMEHVESDVYKVEVPEGAEYVIFCRMNNNTVQNDWNKKWNQTANISLNGANGDMYTKTSWDDSELPACSMR